jgi:CRP-like cAMP-binding protein
MKTTPTPFPADPPADFNADRSATSAAESQPSAAGSLHALIAEQPFFAGLNAHQLQLLTESAMEMRFETGESILQEGSPANRFYVILEGKVVLETELEERGTIPIQTLGSGDNLGWSWLFPPYLLHSSARALEPTRTIFFYGTRLREQCEEDHDFGFELMKRIADVVINQLRATQERLMETSNIHKLSQ